MDESGQWPDPWEHLRHVTLGKCPSLEVLQSQSGCRSVPALGKRVDTKLQADGLSTAIPLLAATGNGTICRHLLPLPWKVWSENQCILTMTFLFSEGIISVLWSPLPVFMELGESWQEDF